MNLDKITVLDADLQDDEIFRILMSDNNLYYYDDEECDFKSIHNIKKISKSNQSILLTTDNYLMYNNDKLFKVDYEVKSFSAFTHDDKLYIIVLSEDNILRIYDKDEQIIKEYKNVQYIEHSQEEYAYDDDYDYNYLKHDYLLIQYEDKAEALDLYNFDIKYEVNTKISHLHENILLYLNGDRISYVYVDDIKHRNTFKIDEVVDFKIGQTSDMLILINNGTIYQVVQSYAINTLYIDDENDNIVDIKVFNNIEYCTNYYPLTYAIVDGRIVDIKNHVLIEI